MPTEFEGLARSRSAAEPRAMAPARLPADERAHAGWFPVRDYNLAATLTSGQVFRWRAVAGGWQGVIGHRWIRLTAHPEAILAETWEPPADWQWLMDYLQLEVDLAGILERLPNDPPLFEAVRACAGLRVLQQDPWECLASFVLSSARQIVQIQQAIETLCRRFGDAVKVPPGLPPVLAFPSAARLAECREAELRACQLGFRAPYLREVAARVSRGEVDLRTLARRPLPEARARLMELPGVGRKIADCVLLFSLGFSTAFPIDTWVRRALHQLYFPRRQPAPARLIEFAETHFGVYAGYAQQYLFHHWRTQRGRT